MRFASKFASRLPTRAVALDAVERPGPGNARAPAWRLEVNGFSRHPTLIPNQPSPRHLSQPVVFERDPVELHVMRPGRHHDLALLAREVLGQDAVVLSKLDERRPRIDVVDDHGTLVVEANVKTATASDH